MPTTTQRKTVESFFNYRPAHIIERIAKENEVSFCEAEARFVECLKLLSLNVLEPNQLHVPSKSVDAAWHAFILHTAEYRQFCRVCLGGFVDHQPSPITPELIAGYTNTIDQIEKYFGKANPIYWSRQSKGWCTTRPSDCNDSGDCGDCGDCHCAGYKENRQPLPPEFLQNYLEVIASN